MKRKIITEKNRKSVKRILRNLNAFIDEKLATLLKDFLLNLIKKLCETICTYII